MPSFIALDPERSARDHPWLSSSVGSQSSRKGRPLGRLETPSAEMPEPSSWEPRSELSSESLRQRRRRRLASHGSAHPEYRRGYEDGLFDSSDDRVDLLIELVKDLDWQMNRLVVWERRLPNALRNAFLSAGLRLPDRLPTPTRRHADGGERWEKPGRQKGKKLTDYLPPD
jgi:hypothetical protein